MVDILILAKSPIPGRVKTRLCPPCAPDQAAALAQAALEDTLAAALEATAGTGSEVVLALDGRADGWLPPGVRVVSQGEGPLDRRLATAWEHVPGPAVQVGMDTPQVTADDLDRASSALARPDVDAVLGPAEDGGWWIIGLPQGGMAEAFLGVDMSQPDTGERQHARLEELGLRVELLEPRNDVDTIQDAHEVAAQAPHTRFAQAFRSLTL